MPSAGGGASSGGSGGSGGGCPVCRAPDPSPGRSPGPPAGMHLLSESVHGEPPPEGVAAGPNPILILTKGGGGAGTHKQTVRPYGGRFGRGEPNEEDPEEDEDEEGKVEAEDQEEDDEEEEEEEEESTEPGTPTRFWFAAATAAVDGTAGPQNPCGSAILDALRSAGDEGRGPVRRRPDDTDLFLAVHHDVYDTQAGLVPGIVYRVELWHAPGGSDIRDLYVETVVGAAGRPLGDTSAAGRFETNGPPPRASDEVGPAAARGPSGVDVDLTGIHRSTWIDHMELDWLQHAMAATGHGGRPLIFGEPDDGDGDGDEGEDDESGDLENSIELDGGSGQRRGGRRRRRRRILYRTLTSYAVYEVIYTMVLLKECQLMLKQSAGLLSSSRVPLGYRDCQVMFPAPPSTPAAEASDELPGLVVQLTRLNTPCRSGGYLRFLPGSPARDDDDDLPTPGALSLCGKLEELPVDERSFHFRAHRNTTVRLHQQPAFALHYRLVDYCYNVTLRDRDASVRLRPGVGTVAGSGTILDCHFRVHLPFGYRIALQLLANGQPGLPGPIGNGSAVVSEPILIGTDKGGGEASAAEVIAGGLLVDLYDGEGRWRRCFNASTPPTRYTLLSRTNQLVVKVRMYGDGKGSGSTAPTPSLLLEYRAAPVEAITSRCAFGWVATAQLCIAAIERRLPWHGAELECNRLGGHLVSIRSTDDQQLIDQVLLNSPGYRDNAAYWIGASDVIAEGTFRWNDKFPFTYTNWFPGWAHHEHYNRQPNDDGLSGQDCIEVRRHFQALAGGSSPMGGGARGSPTLTASYMWNDRNCDASNYFLCERLLDQEPAERPWNEAECNGTITLNVERPKATVWSPGFPQLYPDSVDCYTLIVAPPGYRIVLDFEEMVLEHEPLCSYDYLQLVEPDSTGGPYVPSKSAKYFAGDVLFRSRNSRHSTSRYGDGRTATGGHPRRTKAGPATLGVGELHFNLPNLVLQPNDSRYTGSGPLPAPQDLALGAVPRKMCGDWSAKLKLLRYVTRGPTIGIRFVSDYSNNFGGYKAKVSMENVTSECQDERIKAYNNSCYLVISYPEVDWTTAQQICRGIGAKLASISTTDEQRFITANIRNSPDYTPRSLYWVGGEISANGDLEWTDGVKLRFEGWLPGQRPERGDGLPKSPACLGLQWKVSPTPMISSGLHWTAQRCSLIGGYVCKKPRPTLEEKTARNRTQSGTEGRLLSPGYPNPYPAHTDYWVRLVAPEHSRIIIQFQRLDLEYQDDCLYDYISIQSSAPSSQASASQTPAVTKSLELEPFSAGRSRPIRYVGWSGTPDDVTGNTLPGPDAGDPGVGTPSEVVHPSFLPYVRWCGTHDSGMSRFNFISAANEALIRFHSDFSVTGAGFSATWSTVDVSGCPLQTITSKEGTIRSPNYPHFLLDTVDCTYVIQAPYGRRVWLEFLYAELLQDASLLIDIANGPFEPFTEHTPEAPGHQHLNDGVFVSNGERLVVRLRTGAVPRGKGFYATFKTLAAVNEQRFLSFTNRTSGTMHSLNYPQPIPLDVDYTQHLIAPLGTVILLELYGVGFSQHGCRDTGFIEIYDNYTDSNGTLWHLCELRARNPELLEPVAKAAPIYITSYLNTIHIRQHNVNGTGIRLNATVRLQEDAGYKMKLIANEDEWVEGCRPNPCQHGGKCVTGHQQHQRRGVCECFGHFTGRFCGLNICELEPCLFGKCELTASSFKCNCQPGYLGQRCDQKQKPCAENPCESRGECFEKNGGYYCRCHAWWEGPRCERRMMHIPYKPLSERMLQEPFWLGLITVFVVLAVIGLVWCAKRHFPEKIEKLLADETQRNRPTFPPHHLNTALREQLQASAGTVCSSNATTPASHRTIFGRLGTPSPRKKRNNSTPTKKNVNEKKQILQQLVSPAQNAATKQVSLGELIQMSENRLKAGSYADPEPGLTETTFSENSLSVASMVRQISDPKLEKKVTFARLLSKVSAEMSSGSEVLANGTKHSSALSLPNEVPQRANSVPPSPCTNEVRSPHSTSSNQGSDSLSSSDLVLHDFGLRRVRPKVSSADSILAMFKNFAASSSAIGALQSSIVISPSSTPPTASSPQDDAPGDDDSSTTSSNQTPVSYSSATSDSPVFYRQSTIEVPVLDALSAHKSAGVAGGSSGVPAAAAAAAAQLHPPSILLEIPSNGINNKCLSPIREMPTPIPSPALTPIMPRPYRMRTPQSIHDESMSVTFDGSYGDYHRPHQISIEIQQPDDAADHASGYSSALHASDSAVPAVVCIDVHPPTPDRRTNRHAERPRDLIIPDLIIQQPSPTRERTNVVLIPGSPPPRLPAQDSAAPAGTTSQHQQQRRFLKQWEKPTSLDLPFEPPMITITSNSSELLVSDAEVPSPSALQGGCSGGTGRKPGTGGLLSATAAPPGTTVGMCYLSPFSMAGIRGDRAPSESNLSSSGYSSMASPGPSRCGSNNPLFSAESDDPGSGPSGSSYSGFHALFSTRRQASAQKRKEGSGLAGGCCGPSGSSAAQPQQFRLRSDSETLSDEPLFESNDEGIGTDHLDEKIEEGEICSAKELELYLGQELIQTGQDILGQENPAMAQLQLPSIVIQSEHGCDKLSPVSSRSESPLSERNSTMERFSPMFYGKKDQQLPFTDSDGLYDFPSSDGRGPGTAQVTTSHRKCVGRRKDRRVGRTSAGCALLSPSKSTSLLLEVPHTESRENVTTLHYGAHGVTKFPSCASVAPARKSPKRRSQQRNQIIASSSSSTESLTSTREYMLRPTKGPSSVTALAMASNYPGHMGGSGDDTDEDISSQILPKAAAEEALNKPVHKIRHLKAIGNQIRFLRRLERSIHRREHAQSQPSDEVNCCHDANDSPQTSTPLIKFKQSQIEEEEEPDEDERQHSNSTYCVRTTDDHGGHLSFSRQLCFTSSSSVSSTMAHQTAANSRQHCKISRQRRVPSHDCHPIKPWSEAERKLLENDVNSD
ncbi:uncharacterized protein LOC131213412 [Anopheles bellator]|uniref:uncharacterized protein LOC131213412 n=1 Tax=Anopheles bellator TaxID=139047 RepID=UPI00264A2576|nr:uncharacterized protein LOC131213412 [Anopheles bellator]